ncbi:protein kinase, putative [Plasmodium reichenowi]|uniref:Protein kinase, putative n=1 Tax=Plasmodium reichenowi TaxID=5854 RepID=A0A2P9DRI7_PLARE|nr:protein kinase, putative [Plasmodium reichenowi]
MDYFFNNLFDKKDIQDTFVNLLHEKIKEYIQSGILSNCTTYYKYEIEKCPKEQIKINTKLINDFNEKFLLDILKINNNLKIYYDIKYNVIYSLLLQQYNKNKVIFNNSGHNIIKNLYKIKKKCTSYFINEFLIIKCIHNTQFGNIYYCKNVFNNKKYCMKLFYLIPCLKNNCPYYINDQVFMTNYFHKILNEIFFLIYLKNKNIILIEKIFWDNEKKIICIFLQYIKYQSMYFKKKIGIYSIYKKNKKKCIILEKNNKNDSVQIQLYSEKFLKYLFLQIYKTLISLLKKNVAYHDLKPDNILLNKRNLHEIITCSVQVKNKKKIKNIKKKNLKKNSKIEIVNVEYNIQKEVTNISKKRNRNENNNDLINLYKKNIFGIREKERDKKNEQKIKKKKNPNVHFSPYHKFDLDSMKKNKIKYIYNVKLNKCLEYDEKVKEIFFMKNNLREIFLFSSYNTTVHIQMFVKKKNNISNPNLHQNNLVEQKNNSNNNKRNQMEHMYNIQSEYISTHNMNNNYQINKIRNMSIFKCTPKKYISFLKFYWIYFNKEDLKKQNVDSFLIYLDLYFINKYFNKKFNSNNILGLKPYEKQRIKNKIEHDINKKLHKNDTVKNNAINNNNDDNDDDRFNENNDFFKLIDFDTCSFISQNCNHPGTYIFSPYEALFNVTNKDIDYYKKLSYNFGSVLYTFVYGKPPYYGKDIFEIFQNMQKKLTFPKYRKINKDLRNLLRKLLKKNQDERMQFKKIKRHKWFLNNN